MGMVQSLSIIAVANAAPDPLPVEKCEKQRCKQVRQHCIDRCTDTLPTWDHGKSFFKCLDRCLKEFNCPGLP
jgi:hypothetical protein